jgi:hypothetical protein
MYDMEGETSVSCSMELYCGHLQGGVIEGCITKNVKHLFDVLCNSIVAIFREC